MFVYLSRKLTLPNGVQLTSIAWNEGQGWIACGGSNGMLKVLKADSAPTGPSNAAAAQKGGNNLSMNQTLEGHTMGISVVAWNEQYSKLTSSDAKGQIVVWTLHKGMWFEEMVNDRNKSSVTDLAWNVDGTKVCIVYDDGAVVVGGVDGNRLWGKELTSELTHVTWSPDGKYLLFGTKKGEVLVHDGVGGQSITQVTIFCREDEGRLAGLRWHPAWVNRPDPLQSLAICYKDGKLQLMRGIADERPFIVDAGIPIDCIAWNPQGTILAVSGVAAVAADQKPVVVTQFFSNQGHHLRTMRVAGQRCGGVTWEGTGLRVAIAIDSTVYFASVRPAYKYAYFSKTAVYSFTRPDKTEDNVMFWNVDSGERKVKPIRGLKYVNACGDACVLVSKPDDEELSPCMVQLVNAVGGPIETRFVEIEPYICGMNTSHVVCCGEENVYIWQFRDPRVVMDALDPISMQVSRKETSERIIHIDDIIKSESMPGMVTRAGLTNDFICATALSEDYLFVGRESGVVHVYSLDPLQIIGKLSFPMRAMALDANCDSTLLGVIDLSGVMTIARLDRANLSLVPTPAVLLDFERKDVWSVRWAEDNPTAFAIMERTRMYIFEDMTAEEPVQANGNLCEFKSLKVRFIVLDTIMQDPDRPQKDTVVDWEIKALKDAKDVLSSRTLAEAYQYVDAHPHTKLWELLAEIALEQLDFTIAEMAFIRCRDYPAIQFVKRIRGLDSASKQRAEVLAYYYRFDEAASIYLAMDRKDLALQLRFRLGDWFGVVKLVQVGGGDESLMMQVWENLGDNYADRQKWKKALEYYKHCRNIRKLAHVYYVMEDFEQLAELIPEAEHDKELLMNLGAMFISAGLADYAADAYLRAKEVQKAIDGCIELHQWDRAIAIAEEHHIPETEEYMQKYAAHMLSSDRLPEAIELYRKAGQHGEAAKLLTKLAQRAAETDPLKAKKLYVLSAFEVEKFRKQRIALNKGGTDVVEELLVADRATSSERSLDAAWRGAEAYHYFLLCQQHILLRNLDCALIVAMRLMEYDDLISPVDSYSLIALAAYLDRNYGICSKAFTRLEGAEKLDCDTEDGIPAGMAMAGQKTLLDFANDLDVTHRVTGASGGGSTLGATMAAGANGSTMADGTSTVMMTQLTGASSGAATAVAQCTYPTVNVYERKRSFADLAVKIFTRHKPEDTSVDRVKCTSCGTCNKEWAPACVQCQQPFNACMITGKSISDEPAWQCYVCHHRAIETAAERYHNCPLCHTPRQANATGALSAAIELMFAGAM